RGSGALEREHLRREKLRRASAHRPCLSAPHRGAHRRADRDGLDGPRARRDDPGAPPVPLTAHENHDLPMTRTIMTLNVSWKQYNTLVERLALNVYESGWRFNQIICIARGGLRVGDVLSRI